MLELIAYSMCLAALSMSAFSPERAWGIVALAVAWILIVETVMKFAWDAPISDAQPRWSNQLVSRLGYLRRVPGVIQRFAVATLVVKTTALALALIGTISGWWWGLPLAMLTYVVMQYTGGNVDPSRVTA